MGGGGKTTEGRKEGVVVWVEKKLVSRGGRREEKRGEGGGSAGFSPRFRFSPSIPFLSREKGGRMVTPTRASRRDLRGSNSSESEDLDRFLIKRGKKTVRSLRDASSRWRGLGTHDLRKEKEDEDEHQEISP